MKYLICSILIFGVIVVDLTAAQSLNPNQTTNICTGQNVGDLIADVSDCRRFFSCEANGQALPHICTSFYVFNTTAGECQWGAETECFRCPTDYFIDLPVDYNCIQFVRCFAGHARQLTCSHGLLFDPIHRTCNFENSVTCPCPVVDIPARPLFIRDHTDCEKYSVCTNGTAIERNCQPGLHFNLNTSMCDFAENVDCN